MSVNRNVRCAWRRPRSSFACSASSLAPSRSKVASAPSSSAVPACSSPDRLYARPSRSRARAVSYGAPTACQSSRPCWRLAPRRPSPSRRAGSGPARRARSRRTRRAPLADLVRVHDGLELAERSARRLQVARRDRDLDLGGSRRTRRQRIPDVRERVCDARDGGVDLALCKPQQCEPGLRVATELVRRCVRLLGAREVSAPCAGSRRSRSARRR